MYETYNPYGVYNPYYNNYNYTPQIPKQNQSMYRPQLSALQGKVVDSLDVVKATDIPYDGSISYFPLTDGSAIITKQLQQDGTSKVIVYKPSEMNNPDNMDNQAKYVTEEDLAKQLRNINDKYVTGEDFKEQLKSINSKDIKDMKEDIKSLKRKLEDITDDLKYKKEK